MIDCSMLKWRQLATALHSQADPERFTGLLEGAFFGHRTRKKSKTKYDANSHVPNFQSYGLFRTTTNPHFIMEQTSRKARNIDSEQSKMNKILFRVLTWIGWNWLPIRWVPNNSNQFAQSSKIFQSSKTTNNNNNATEMERVREKQKKSAETINGNQMDKVTITFSHDLHIKRLCSVRIPVAVDWKSHFNSTSYTNHTFIGRKLISVSKFLPSVGFGFWCKRPLIWIILVKPTYFSCSCLQNCRFAFRFLFLFSA